MPEQEPMTDIQRPALADQLCKLEPEQIMNIFAAAMIMQANATLVSSNFSPNGRLSVINLVTNGEPGQPRREISIRMRVQDA